VIVIAVAIGVVILLVAAVIYLTYSEADRRHVGAGCAAVRCYAICSPMLKAET
jgi:hypothetical protein